MFGFCLLWYCIDLQRWGQANGIFFLTRFRDLVVELSVCRMWTHRRCRSRRAPAWRLRVATGGCRSGLPSGRVAHISGPAVGAHAFQTIYLDRRLARNRDPLRMKMRRGCPPTSSVDRALCRHCAATVRPISNRAELPMVRCCTGRLRAVGGSYGYRDVA